jgi:hypothetical protein
MNTGKGPFVRQKCPLIRTKGPSARTSGPFARHRGPPSLPTVAFVEDFAAPSSTKGRRFKANVTFVEIEGPSFELTATSCDIEGPSCDVEATPVKEEGAFVDHGGTVGRSKGPFGREEGTNVSHEGTFIQTRGPIMTTTSTSTHRTNLSLKGRPRCRRSSRARRASSSPLSDRPRERRTTPTGLRCHAGARHSASRTTSSLLARALSVRNLSSGACGRLGYGEGAKGLRSRFRERSASHA